MNLELSDEQRELQATLRRWAATDASVATQARPLLDGATWAPDGAWQALVDMGVTSALGVVDAAVVAEELGRVLYPGPWRSTMAAWTAIFAAWNSRWAGVRVSHGTGRFTSRGPSFSIASGKA